jgi:hypothetical protein
MARDPRSAEIDRAVSEHARWLLGQPGVSSVCTIEDGGEFKMFVGHTGLAPEAKDAIEQKVGVPVKFSETGTFRPL